MLEQFLPLTVFASLTLTLGAIVLLVSSYLGPRTSSKHKFDPYECGMDQMDNPHKPYAIKFYAVALIFMLFDIETIFLLPWAVGYKSYGSEALIAIIVFMAVPALGLWYVLRSGAFKWE
jgi:NADH-quinone oxidoreductase subunit A